MLLQNCPGSLKTGPGLQQIKGWCLATPRNTRALSPIPLSVSPFNLQGSRGLCSVIQPDLWRSCGRRGSRVIHLHDSENLSQGITLQRGGNPQCIVCNYKEGSVGSEWALESPQVGSTAWMMMSYVAPRMSHQPDDSVSHESCQPHGFQQDRPSRRQTLSNICFRRHPLLLMQSGQDSETPQDPWETQRGPGLSAAGMRRMIGSSYV